jgi:hypothetical protein
LVVKNNLLNKIRSLKCYQLRYRDVQKVLCHCNFFKLYILYETTFFSKHFFKVNCCLILMKFLPTKARMYLVFCDYFKIFFWNTDFEYSRFKHKLKSFIFKSTIIVLCFWHSKFGKWHATSQIQYIIFI